MGERLELLANGEVLARYYRHPATLAHAVEAGASWEQIAAARGTSAEQARQDYREWAEGQHGLWTGKWGGEPGRSGLDDAGYAEAIARAAEPDPGAAKAYAATHRDAVRSRRRRRPGRPLAGARREVHAPGLSFQR